MRGERPRDGRAARPALSKKNARRSRRMLARSPVATAERNPSLSIWDGATPCGRRTPVATVRPRKTNEIELIHPQGRTGRANKPLSGSVAGATSNLQRTAQTDRAPTATDALVLPVVDDHKGRDAGGDEKLVNSVGTDKEARRRLLVRQCVRSGLATAREWALGSCHNYELCLTTSAAIKCSYCERACKQKEKHTHRSEVGASRRGRLDIYPFWRTQHKFAPPCSCGAISGGPGSSWPTVEPASSPMSTVTSTHSTDPLLAESRRSAPSRRGVRE